MFKNKRKISGTVFLYLLTTSLLWAFLVSYSNSYNRMNEEQITPANINISKNEITVNILHSEFTTDTELFSPESNLYYFSYLLSSDSLRISQAMLIKAVESLSF